MNKINSSREMKYAREISVIWLNLRKHTSRLSSAQRLVDEYVKLKGLDIMILTALTFNLIGKENWFGLLKLTPINIEEL